MPRVRRATPMSPSLARKVAVLLDEARPGEAVRRLGWMTLKCVVMDCDRRRAAVGDVASSSSNASSAGTRGSIGAMVSGRRGSGDRTGFFDSEQRAYRRNGRRRRNGRSSILVVLEVHRSAKMEWNGIH